MNNKKSEMIFSFVYFVLFAVVFFGIDDPVKITYEVNKYVILCTIACISLQVILVISGLVGSKKDEESKTFWPVLHEILAMGFLLLLAYKINMYLHIGVSEEYPLSRALPWAILGSYLIVYGVSS